MPGLLIGCMQTLNSTLNMFPVLLLCVIMYSIVLLISVVLSCVYVLPNHHEC